MHTETLEGRQLMAADLGDVSIESTRPALVQNHNYVNRWDVNDDRAVTPLDALAVLNDLRRQSTGGEGELAPAAALSVAASASYTDVNADGEVSPLDALSVLNVLRRGEGETTPLLELALVPTDGPDDTSDILDDVDADGDFNVDTGQIFYLEARYNDLRPFDDRLGVFNLLTDFFGSAFDDGNLEPVLTEAQQITLVGGVDTSGTSVVENLRFTRENSTAEVLVSREEIGDNGLGAAFETALEGLGFDPSEFDVVREAIDGDQLLTVTFLDSDFFDVDVDDITVEVLTSDSSTPEVRFFEAAPRINGVPNGDAVPFNIRYESRAADGSEVYDDLPEGDFDAAGGVLTVGGLAFSSTSSLPELLGEDTTPRPFDTYRIPVRFTAPGEDLEVSIRGTSENASEVAIALYGIEPARNLMPGEVTLDEDATIRFDVGGDTMVDVMAGDQTVNISEGDGTATVDLSTLLTGVATANFAVVSTAGDDIGDAAISGNILTFTLDDDDVNGTATVTYSATSGGDSDNGVITINVAAVNDPPMAENDSGFSTAADTAVNIPIATLLSNDTDVEDTDLMFALVDGSATGGTAVVQGDDVVFTPAAGFTNDNATFDYQVTDGGGLSDTATVTVAVGDALQPPTASDRTESATEDTTATFDIADSIAGQFDTVAIADNGSLGTATVDGTVITYVPNADANGQDTFTYRVSNTAGSNEATITVNIAAVNDAPIPVDDGPFTLNRDTSITLTAGQLVGNDDSGAADENDTLTIAAVTAGSTNGSVVLNGDGSVTYTPAAGFFGNDSFTYTVNDGTVTSATAATVTLQIDDVLAAPIAGDADRQITQGNTITVDLDTLLTGGAVADSDLFLVGDGGLTASIAGRTLTITAADTLGDFDVVYRAGNASGTDEGTINVTVVERDDPPVTGGDLTRTASEDDAPFFVDLADGVTDDGGSVDVINVEFADDDDDDNGGVTINNDGTLSVTPSFFGSLTDGESATVTVSYQVTDNVNDPVDRNAIITITGVNDAPVATDDAATAFEGNPLRIDVLANDNAGGGEDQDLTVSTANVTSGTGTVMIVDGGDAIVFTPAANSGGTTATITYTVTDEQGLSDTATVTVDIQAFQPSTISGAVFQDELENLDEYLDGADPVFNGIRDPGERAFAGIPVRLTGAAGDNATGTAVDVVVLTDVNGSYSFQNVAPGTYTVTVEAPDSIRSGAPRSSVVTIGPEGGAAASGPTLAPATLDSSLSNLDVLASTYLRLNRDVAEMSGFGREGATIGLGGDGSQNVIIVGEGFEGVRLAQLSMSDTMDSALLTVLMDDGSVRSAVIGSDNLLVGRDGDAVRLFGGMDDFDFFDPETSADDDAFGDYRDLIDQVLTGN